jgi:hypothetical protein
MTHKPDSNKRKKRWESLKSITYPRIVEYVVEVKPHQPKIKAVVRRNSKARAVPR